MDFRKKLNLRLYTAICILCIGIIMIITSFFGADDMMSSLGLIFVVIGLARIIQYRRITKDEESLHRREVAETDERNVMLWTIARSLTFSVYVLVSAVAVIVLFLLDMDIYAQIISYSLFAFVGIYWLCYFIVSRKY